MIRILLLSVLALSSICSFGQVAFTITQQPVTALNICQGNIGALSIRSNGNSDRIYQWQKFNTTTGVYSNLVNGTSYSNATITLTNPNRNTTTTFGINTSILGVAAAGTYRCIVYDGSTTGPSQISNSVTVTITARPSITNGLSCGAPKSVVLTAAGATNGQYRWYTASGIIIPGETSSIYNTPPISVSTYYYVTINNGTCETSSTYVLAQIINDPAPPTTPDASCPGASLTLRASAGYYATFRWYTVPTGGTAIPGETDSTYVTPVLNTSATYYVSVYNTGCESPRSSVLAQIYPMSTPTTTGNSSCTPAALLLNAIGGTNGQYRWWVSTSAKTSIAGQINSSYTTPMLSVTTTYYVSIDNGTCESARIPVVAQINTTPAAPTTTGSSACGTSALTLSAAGGTNGQYRWYTAATGGSPITGQTNSTYLTPSLTSTTTYYVAINNGNCESLRISVMAQINTAPAIPTTTGNASCASPASLLLSATGGTNGQYRWYGSATDTTPIAGQTNSTFTTPSISVSSTYYVSINNGPCESTRTPVTAQINTPPASPVAVNNSLCAPGSVSLNATGAKDGQYRWYTSSTGGQAIASEVNGHFLTPSISTTTSYYAAINNGICESVRTQVTATIGGTGCNNAPVIQPSPITTQIEGKVTLDLVKLISDKDGNLDLNTLKVVVPPASGASASITTTNALILDYSSTPFSGLEYLTIEVCDLAGACTQRQLSVEVAGDIIVYNAISPGNDGKNDIFLIKYIDILNNTQKNHVYIYSRWGDVVFDIVDYNNTTKVFRGLNNSGNEIPSGTYFYKVEFANGKASKTGYITLKR